MALFHTLRVLSVAGALAALPHVAHADEPTHIDDSFIPVSVSGFATLAGTKLNASDHKLQFKSNNRMVSGTRAGDSWEWDNDSDAGVQARLTPWRSHPQFSLVTQLLSRRNQNNSQYPTTDWFYLAYQPDAALTFRLGRFIAPVYMASEYRNVNFSNPWLRPPLEVYSMASINNIDGFDAIYRSSSGDVSYTLQPYFGHFDLKQPDSTIFRFHTMAGLNSVVEYGALSVRIGYMYARHSVIRKPQYTTLANYSESERTDQYRGEQPCNSKAGYGSSCPYGDPVSQVYPGYSKAAAYYDRNQRPFDIAGLGFVYDKNLFMQGEWVYKHAASASPNAIGWYLTGGWRAGDFLPYVTYAHYRELARSDTLYPAAQYSNAQPVTLSSSSDNRQRTLSLGVRYDLSAHTAVKLQYDRITPQHGTISHNSHGLGWINTPDDFSTYRHLEVLAASLDVVF